MILTPHQLPISEYHGAGGCPRWWSKTSLMNYKKYGPKWMGLYLQGQIHTERPDGALQGQAIDCYLTEGAEAFAKQWAIKPDGLSLATKEGKAWKLDHDGKEILSHRDNLILCDAPSRTLSGVTVGMFVIRSTLISVPYFALDMMERIASLDDR